ncbi:MAG: hypothetical protein IKK26_03515, partial [Clostridia bacterium]|nr:hypothetical protein [Clostridia bacterium]
MKNYISNEQFRVGCRCRRLLWIQEQEKNKPIEFCPELSALAQNYVYGGETVWETELSERSEETLRLAKGGAKVIKRPAFKAGDSVAVADLLVFHKDSAIIYFS